MSAAKQIYLRKISLALMTTSMIIIALTVIGLVT
jgi:hypothetical protein